MTNHEVIRRVLVNSCTNFCPPSQECLKNQSDSRYACLSLSTDHDVIGIGLEEVDERVLVIELAGKRLG